MAIVAYAISVIIYELFAMHDLDLDLYHDTRSNVYMLVEIAYMIYCDGTSNVYHTSQTLRDIGKSNKCQNLTV